MFLDYEGRCSSIPLYLQEGEFWRSVWQSEAVALVIMSFVYKSSVEVCISEKGNM